MQINREFDSNEMDEIDLQREKHDEPRISTFLEITIDSSDHLENASDSNWSNREFDSNEMDASDLLKIHLVRSFQNIIH
jgi:hypothetical protein